MSSERETGETIEGESVPPPTGTIFVLGLYMLVLAVAWCAMFWMLMER
jgi:hypothetical protein